MFVSYNAVKVSYYYIFGRQNTEEIPSLGKFMGIILSESTFTQDIQAYLNVNFWNFVVKL